MSKKKKKPEFPAPTIDPNLEKVDEDRAFEIEYDEETNEAIIVNHYRRQWGDGFDADVEHGLNVEENNALITTLMEILEMQKKKAMANVGVQFETVSTPILLESNPLKGPKEIGGDEKKVEEKQ